MAIEHSPSLLTRHPFRELIELPEFAKIRRDYAARSAEKRRRAAEWEYARDIGYELFSQFDPEFSAGDSYGDSAVLALVIDPGFAPAILTVGSVEYQLGRIGEAISLFSSLPALSGDDAGDLGEIIDKAADFLIDRNDFANAQGLYESAIESFPHAACYHAGLGYCAAKAGRKQDAVEHNRRAVSLNPADATSLSNLGWSLLEAGEYEEAEAVLEKALLRDPDHELARANLEYLREIHHKP